MRTLATSLLILAAIIFLLVHLLTDMTGVWGFVARASEAAMIGAIADWFAVTALFRHPMGLPIPHTAIIPRKKDTLGTSLSHFVAANFLQAETVSTKIRTAELTRRAGDWLIAPRNQDIVVRRAGQGLEYVLARVDDEAIADLTRNVLVPKLVSTRKSPALGMLIREIVDEGAHHHLVDLIVGEAHTWLSENPQVIDDIVQQKSPDWAPRFVNDVVSNRLRREVLGWTAEVRDDRFHRARQALDAWLVEVSQDLRGNTPLSVRAEKVLDDLLTQDGVVDAVLEIWSSLKRLLRAAVLDEAGPVHARVRALLTEAAERMRTDRAFASEMDERIATTVGDLVESFGPELASVISDTIADWDAKEAADRIELYVGRDLQYIRINGTVIGALVGIAIHALTLVLPGG
ncbi:Uncharacterized membrane-anchored protein YjiN, DUF445 family [Brevibacterium jeotgali]|uniref:Uncharacterized membrane-anchored protein YjiN, DUF445 family n=2 Tax=Brevibacterium jeotgali TaxID=1262550 RepID=A0A2H1L6I3_9MICO|nr:uncharacterized membrane-anchored protein YjiN (DUF445 family) [Brevibacterium jeotgali]SMY11973.1 Uncharacterized membrane-anchored protein YjiN, DUF445 family [Brevibacterium jeotgali]